MRFMMISIIDTQFAKRNNCVSHLFRVTLGSPSSVSPSLSHKLFHLTLISMLLTPKSLEHVFFRICSKNSCIHKWCMPSYFIYRCYNVWNELGSKLGTYCISWFAWKRDRWLDKNMYAVKYNYHLACIDTYQATTVPPLITVTTKRTWLYEYVCVPNVSLPSVSKCFVSNVQAPTSISSLEASIYIPLAM